MCLHRDDPVSLEISLVLRLLMTKARRHFYENTRHVFVTVSKEEYFSSCFHENVKAFGSGGVL